MQDSLYSFYLMLMGEDAPEKLARLQGVIKALISRALTSSGYSTRRSWLRSGFCGYVRGNGQ